MPTRIVLRRATVSSLAALAAAASWAPPAPAAPAGLRLVSSWALDSRLRELILRTPAVEGPTKVRVLLPAGYARSTRRYPVLYLLHGCCSIGYRMWTEGLQAERLTAGRRLIVVMPDSGPGGGYIDWWNGGAGGPPEWETYHVKQLIPFLDRRYRTIADRTGRAIAGMSMGGFGALSYAARHPDVFAAASSYSGAADLNVVTPALNAIGQRDDRASGPYETEQVRTRAVNPWDLAENLRGLSLVLRTGNGAQDGRLVDLFEFGVYNASLSLHERLAGLGIPHTWDFYGPGTHTAPFWMRDLQRDLPRLTRVFAHPRRPPKRVTFRAAEPSYSVYGWTVRLRRRAMEFSELRDADRTGFILTGSGSASVTTPSVAPAGTRYHARIHTRSGERRLVLRADARGRLVIPVGLGPANTIAQYTPQERSAPSRFFRATVRLRELR